MIKQRRYDLDWLRVIAFIVLVYFHAAILFIPGGLPMIQNQQTSVALEHFVDISSRFRLGLLFFISGAGVVYARRRLDTKAFIRQRCRRLLVPALFAVLVLVPPIVYLEKCFLGQFEGSFLAFYPTFFSAGVYPNGNLSWHHCWFLVYLFIYCLLGVKLIPLCEPCQRLARRYRGAGIYGLILPLLVIELTLRPLFPGFRDLLHDWASFSQWLTFFVAGALMAQHQSLLEVARRFRYLSLTCAVTCTALAYWWFGGFNVTLDAGAPLLLVKYLLYCLLCVAVAWCAVLASVGFAAQHLRFDHPMLAYLNQAVYPLFLLHLTLLSVLGYWVVQQPWGIWWKYLWLTSACLIIALGLYHWLVRPWQPMRWLFGLRTSGDGSKSRGRSLQAVSRRGNF